MKIKQTHAHFCLHDSFLFILETLPTLTNNFNIAGSAKDGAHDKDL